MITLFIQVVESLNSLKDCVTLFCANVLCFQDVTLRETVSSGVAYVHEGLDPSDKTVVEQLYNSGAIQVICYSVLSFCEL